MKLTTTGTIAPAQMTITAEVASDLTSGEIRAFGHTRFHARGSRNHVSAAAPTVASICAAGPVRVCHSSKSDAAIPGTAAPMIRRRSSRSARFIQASRIQPIAPVTGSAAISVAMRHPWR